MKNERNVTVSLKDLKVIFKKKNSCWNLTGKQKKLSCLYVTHALKIWKHDKLIGCHYQILHFRWQTWRYRSQVTIIAKLQLYHAASALLNTSRRYFTKWICRKSQHVQSCFRLTHYWTSANLRTVSCRSWGAPTVQTMRCPLSHRPLRGPGKQDRLGCYYCRCDPVTHPTDTAPFFL